MSDYTYDHLGHKIINETKIVEIKTPTQAELTANAIKRLNHPEMKPVKKKKGGKVKKKK